MLTDPQKVFDNAEEMAARYKQMLLEQADESETDSLVEEETAELD
jgi:small subunit ribosomal protein S1